MPTGYEVDTYRNIERIRKAEEAQAGELHDILLELGKLTGAVDTVAAVLERYLPKGSR